MEKGAVLIYAAGVGSRMKNITDHTSKCIIDLGGVTPLEHTIRSFVNCGITNVILVIGYYADRVKTTVTEFLESKHICANVTFIMNDKYDYHGCEYSIACACKAMQKYDTVYITEGDMLLDESYIRQISENNGVSSALIRNISYIDPQKSVIACGQSDDKICRFVYDETHQSVIACLPQGMTVLGDSLQLWKFKNGALSRLRELLATYYEKANTAGHPEKANGLETINQVCGEYFLVPIKAEGGRCINLNTEADIKAAKKADWLNR